MAPLALSDPTRLGIITRLRGGEQCVCELMDELDATVRAVKPSRALLPVNFFCR